MDGQRLLSSDLAAPLSGARGTDPLGTVDLGLASRDGAELGLWEAGPGEDVDVEVDEVFVVLAGGGLLTFEDGTTVELRPGAVVQVHAGDRTHWQISERLRKLYVTGFRA
jgi:uncharacterized cupin superfamily protein